MTQIKKALKNFLKTKYMYISLSFPSQETLCLVGQNEQQVYPTMFLS